MSDSISGGMQEPAAPPIQRVAGGAQGGAEQVAQATPCGPDALAEVRGVIRAQPITAALIVFFFGYLFGRLGSLIPSVTRRS